jgi:glycosyltransferase involved in cell wall biosynthesis
MRVVFVTYYYSPYVSGLTLCTRALAEGLAACGFDVHVVAARHVPGLPSEEVMGGVTVHRLRPLAGVDKGIVVPALLPRALGLASGGGIVVPVLPLMEAAAISYLLPRGRVCPFYVCDLRLGDGLAGRALERLAHASARAAIRRAPAYAALSEEYARASRVIGDINRPVVGVLPPVDPARFRRCDAAGMRARLDIPVGAPVIGFLGRLVAEKGIPVLLEAMTAVRAAMPEACLVIGGDGDAVAGGGLGPALRRLAGDAGASVIFTGFLADDDLPAFYSMLDVLALPSTDPLEAYGMVQVEGMLCGCPAVASDMPGVRIPITRTGMGLLVPPGDASALSDALLRVLRERDAFVVSHDEVAQAIDPRESIEAMASLLGTIGRSRR